MANLGNNINTLGGSDINELLDISDLTYLATPESNVVTARRQKTHTLNEEYTAGEIISFIIETGQDYVSWLDSTLNFELILLKVNAAAAAGATFGGGSVLNLLKKITITTASGDKITELSKANVWNYYNDKLTHSHQWRTVQGGKLLGYNTTLVSGTKWVIPLSSICEFFSLDVLTPNVVANGLKIDIELEAVATAFQDVTIDPDKVDTYKVKNPEIRLDHYTLSGGAMNALNTMSATSGLVLNYSGVTNSPYNKTGAFDKFTNKVSDGLSMVSSAWTAIRDSTFANDITKDSFESRTPQATDSYKYRLGSTNMPEEDIVGLFGWYNQMAYATSSLKHKKELGVTFAEFGSNAMAVASIDRYWTAGSGMAINQSTSLSITATVDTAAAVVDTFVVHQIRSVSFMEKTTVFN